MCDSLTADDLVDAGAAGEPVRTLLRGPAVAVERHDALRDVARDLAAGAADAALVVSPIGEVGIVTARDIVAVVAAGGAVEDEQVRGAMSSELVTADADAPIAVVGRTMVAAGVGHVVVLDGLRAVGVVCLDDVLDALLA